MSKRSAIERLRSFEPNGECFASKHLIVRSNDNEGKI